jgi:hypothetical protein
MDVSERVSSDRPTKYLDTEDVTQALNRSMVFLLQILSYECPCAVLAFIYPLFLVD